MLTSKVYFLPEGRYSQGAWEEGYEENERV
jgi:hypothetical protein